MRKSLLIAGGIVLCGGSLRATEYSAPVGCLVQPLPATGPTATTTYLGIPLSLGSLFSGRVTAVGAGTLSVDPASGWTDGQFTATPCYVRVTSGAQAGRTLAVLASTTTTLTLDLTDGSEQTTALDAADFALAAGDTFEIVPDRTLGSLFSGIADQVGLWNLRLGAFENYSFDAAANRWTKDGASAADDYTNLPVPPNTAVAVVRAPGRAAGSLVTIGFPATISPLIKLAGDGAGQYIGLPLAVDTLLVNLDLGLNWRRKAAYEKADVLSLYKTSVGKWKDYFQRKDHRWLRPNGTIKDSVLVPAGSAVGLTERRAVSDGTSFLQLGLPYAPSLADDSQGNGL